jgi:tRNA threonylcarbamoyladenosine biosynthesis protein TsaE
MTGPRLGPGKAAGPSYRQPGLSIDARTVSLPSPADTFALGERLGGVLRAGDLVVLTGPLGAGKTALTQGIGAGLGVRGTIVSPTFVIARVHRSLASGPPLVHVDAYRLGSLDEVDDLDLDVEVADSVIVVEWGAGLVEQLAESYLLVEISRSDTSDERSARLVPHGGDWAARVAAVAAGR